jgi:hypothetical protein
MAEITNELCQNLIIRDVFVGFQQVWMLLQRPSIFVVKLQ